MTEQGRNERCSCGSGKKHKKCCGRFSLRELSDKMREFAETNTQTHMMIERAIELLSFCAEENRPAMLCLAKPTSTSDGDFVDWTTIPASVPLEQREALVTRRALSGYIPIGVLIRNCDWQSVICPPLIPDETYWQFYIPFARRELSIIANTLDGDMPMEDSWMTRVTPSDLQHPPSQGHA